MEPVKVINKRSLPKIVMTYMIIFPLLQGRGRPTFTYSYIYRIIFHLMFYPVLFPMIQRCFQADQLAKLLIYTYIYICIRSKAGTKEHKIRSQLKRVGKPLSMVFFFLFSAASLLVKK